MAKKPDDSPAPDEPRRGLSGFQKVIFGLLALVFVGSLGARAAGLGSSGDAGSDQPRTTLAPGGSGEAGEKSFLPGLPGSEGEGATTGAPESGSIESLLPVFTEASFFGLIGFSLGYLSRKVIKLLLIFVALFFLGIQGLQYAGVIQDVDWPMAIEYVNDFVLNLKENNTLTEWLTDRVPTAGALVAGYFVGLKRG